MEQLTIEQALKKWQSWWNDLEKEWFRVEMLQDYSAQDDCISLRAWLAGNKQKAIALLQQEDSDNEWVKEAQRKGNVRKIRFHITEEPYTPYLQWEIENYRHVNIPFVKEEIYLMSKTKVSHLQWSDGDFAIFDDKRVVKLNYSLQGKATSAEMYNVGDDINHFLKFKNELWKLKNLASKVRKL